MIVFQTPLVLAAFLPIGALVIVTGRPPRRIITTAARLALLLALLLALAGPERTVRTERPSRTLYLLDVSESIHPDEIERALDALPPDAEVLLFAGDVEPLTDRRLALHRRTEVELRLAAEAGSAKGYEDLLAWKERMQTDRTDLSRALTAARARFRAGFENHIALISDGRAESPQPDRVTYFPVSAKHRDVALLAARAPIAVRSGEPFDLRVEVEAS